jgi:HEAT repeat protein
MKSPVGRVLNGVLGVLLGTTLAHAEPPKGTAPGSLGERLDPAVAERLLASANESDRLRGIERLGALGNARALELIGRALDTETGKSARLRLTAVRALKRHAADPGARASLVRLMTSGETAGCTSELDRWVRASAALALAAGDSPAAVNALGQALRHEGPVASAAAEALVAYPPRNLEPLLGARGGATVTLIEALERLGDQRAFTFLRRLVRAGSVPVRARAAVALTRLGDFETIELGRYWLEHEKVGELRRAAAWVLALGHASEAPRAIAELCGNPGTASQCLELALAFPHPDVVPALEERLGVCTDECEALLTAIGRAGGTRGARALAARLGHVRLGRSAAYALALAPGTAARAALARALLDPSLRTLAARAAVIRRIELGERVAGLDDTLASLLVATDPDQRAAGSWGTGTLHPERIRQLIASPDPAMVRAAARALVASDDAVRAAERWTREPDPMTRAAFGVGLLSWGGADRVPTDKLLARLQQSDPLAPLIARALAARDSADLRPVVEGLLASGDPSVRGHTALGLERSRHPGAIALLDRAYQFETDPGVRRAVVRALSGRAEPARWRTLELAAALDPDPDTRAAARWALAGHRLVVRETGPGTLWLDVAAGAGEREPIRSVAMVTTATGLAVPAVTDPGGLLVLSGLARGPVGIRLVALEP